LRRVGDHFLPSLFSLTFSLISPTLSLVLRSQDLFNSDGTQYNQSLILTDGKFDEAKYAEVGSAWFSSTNALYLVVDNLSVGATLVTAFLFYWPEIKPIFLQLNPWSVFFVSLSALAFRHR